MKTITALLVLLSLALSLPAFAIAPGATPIQVNMATASVSASTWKVLVSSTVRAIKSMSVYNTGTSTLEIGVAKVGSASGAEVAQFLLPASTAGAVHMYSVPIVEPAPVRVSVLSLGALGSSTGELGVSLIY